MRHLLSRGLTTAFFMLSLALPGYAFAADAAPIDAPPNPDAIQVDTGEYLRGVVTAIVGEGTEGEILKQVYQTVAVRLESGANKGNIVIIKNIGDASSSRFQRFKKGESVIVYKMQTIDETGAAHDDYYLDDAYRLPFLLGMFCAFFALVIFFGRWKGFTSIFGLLFSLGVLIKGILPAILAGRDPLAMTLLGALVIVSVSLFLAHGFNKRTGLAYASTLVTLGIATVLAFLAVKGSRLLGLGSEEALYLQGSMPFAIDLQGLLLGGIIIGTLGVLDDVTTAQTAAVHEISKANPKLGILRLYRHGFSVGNEHIASLVNTLVLAYAGVSLPLFLLFSMYRAQPLWVLINSELISDEIVRTLVGSVALVLAVPISTFLAAYVFGRRNGLRGGISDDASEESFMPHAHSH